MLIATIFWQFKGIVRRVPIGRRFENAVDADRLAGKLLFLAERLAESWLPDSPTRIWRASGQESEMLEGFAGDNLYKTVNATWAITALVAFR